ncbi:MAG: c-type cytochrome [Pirellulales bacterium]|nr:c-type cytochrome [Pirellulales bacterium]
MPLEQQRGYRILIEQAFVPASLDQELFDNMWKVWEEPARTEAEKATAAERRRMTLSRYGLMDAPGREGGIPMQYADDGQGGWSSNCLLCHGGKVAGKVIAGVPNTHIALETLSHETYKTKKLLGREVSPVEVTGLMVPLGKSNGTTNAIIFGVALAAFRDPDLNFHPENPMPKLVHNDHDAPPWWHVKRKEFLYADGFAGKGHRALMQFMMVPSNGPEMFHKSEAAFKEIYDWVQHIEAPKYPFEIDEALAKQGEMLFNKTCADCHGTYGKDGQWPGEIVPLDVVGTDRARLDSLTPEMRASYELSWFSNYGEKKSIHDPGGYVAQPLDGIWASAPYFHNGSVPTLWHLMHPDQRPKVWQRTEDGYDRERVGLEVTEFTEMPSEANTPVKKRTYFDTGMFAKSAGGHTFPDKLNEEEKRAVLEYLKTL